MTLHRSIQEAINRAMSAQALWFAVHSNPQSTDRLIEATEESAVQAQENLGDLLTKLEKFERKATREDA